MTDTNTNTPVIEQEITSLSDKITNIIASYEKVSQPLIESSANVPKATAQLDKVSRNTEDAAHLILDTIEQVLHRQDTLLDLLNIVENEIGTHGDSMEKIKKAVHENTNDIYIIMDALQFQDITTQQLNHSISLLEELRKSLHAMLKLLHGKDTFDSMGEYTPPEYSKAFDPGADCAGKQTEQADVDSLFANRERHEKD